MGIYNLTLKESKDNGDYIAFLEAFTIDENGNEDPFEEEVRMLKINNNTLKQKNNEEFDIYFLEDICRILRDKYNLKYTQEKYKDICSSF